MRRIGFTGTSQPVPEAQREALRRLLQDFEAARGGGEVEFHHGGCIGADQEAHYLAVALGWRVEVHPGPNAPFQGSWEGSVVVHTPYPNLDRNRHIVQLTEHLVACPRGFREELRSGTWATVRYARSLQRPVTLVWPDGRVELEVRTEQAGLL